MKGQRKVSVMAMNLMVGDVVNGERISNIIRFTKRSRNQLKAASIGVLVVTPHPKGYDVNTRKFVGFERVTIQRPKKNRPKVKRPIFVQKPKPEHVPAS